MKTRQIRIDDDVFAELQRIAAEQNLQFAKANVVLRWVLRLPPPGDDDQAPTDGGA